MFRVSLGIQGIGSPVEAWQALETNGWKGVHPECLRPVRRFWNSPNNQQWLRWSTLNALDLLEGFETFDAWFGSILQIPLNALDLLEGFETLLNLVIATIRPPSLNALDLLEGFETMLLARIAQQHVSLNALDLLEGFETLYSPTGYTRYQPWMP